MHVTKHRALALFTVLALAACSGKDGTVGPKGDPGTPGTNGTNGTNGSNGINGTNGKDLTAGPKAESCDVCHPTAGTQHQAIYNEWVNGLGTATKFAIAPLAAPVTSAGTQANLFKSTLTFTLYKNGVPLVDCADPIALSGNGLAGLKQKTIYFTTYNSTTGKFVTPAATPTAGYPVDAANFTFNSIKCDGVAGRYTATRDNLSADPMLAATDAFVYGYFGDANLSIPANTNTNRHYALMDNMISFAKVVKGAINYTSTAVVAGCERCHGAPYSKHGYRQAKVSGLNDFVACKACHTDQRVGSDAAWYLLVDDPAAYAAQNGTPTAAQLTKYAYTANVMNDTHNSHAFEFAYPQSMSNCTTCHAGKLDLILTDANFTATTCKSCHPVKGVGGTSEKRAPSLAELWTGPLATIHPAVDDMYTFTGQCNLCHTTGGVARTFGQIHKGYDTKTYSAAPASVTDFTTKFSKQFTVAFGAVSFDAATNKLTIPFTATKASGSTAPQTIASLNPTVVISLYGFDSKDFIVSGHGSQPAPDSKRNLEWANGSTSNSPRLTVTGSNGAFTATADLSLWANRLATTASGSDKAVARVEIGVMPSMPLDPAKAVQNDKAKADYNPAVALDAATVTFNLVSNAKVTGGVGTAIVDPAKCNKCHDALGTTFHTPDRGGNVVNCRLCHAVPSGGSHLEMQSRSIDSYVHALHSFQPMDIQNVDFANAVQKLEYNEHIDSEYPNFTTFNCESCHNAGTYDVPDQTKSLVGLLSASRTTKNWDRNVGTVASYAVGPAARACGACHRAKMINEDDASKLASFYGHQAAFGTQVDASTSSTTVLEDAWAKIAAIFK